MPTSLPRSTPTDQGVDPAAVLNFLDALDERPDIEMHTLMVVRHGRVVAEGWWAPYRADRPQLLYSLSKSFTATAAAFAQAEGPHAPQRPCGAIRRSLRASSSGCTAPALTPAPDYPGYATLTWMVG
jgi:CubicO group peptidase (beta-lactamase class C family)